MTDPPRGAIEVPINKSPENQLAKGWLLKAKVPANPLEPYVIQLAVWGLEEPQNRSPDPMSPSDPLPEEVESLTYRLLVTGAKPCHQAMRYLLGNPNLTQAEQQANLNHVLTAAQSPQEAAAAVLETIHDLMVAMTE